MLIMLLYNLLKDMMNFERHGHDKSSGGDGE